MSTTRSESFSAPAPPGRAAGVFALPEILPERARVFLDMPSRTAVLLNLLISARLAKQDLGMGFLRDIPRWSDQGHRSVKAEMIAST